MRAGAAQVVAVVAGNKLAIAAPYVIAPMEALTRVVTDQPVAECHLVPYPQIGIQVAQAGGDGSDV